MLYSNLGDFHKKVNEEPHQLLKLVILRISFDNSKQATLTPPSVAYVNLSIIWVNTIYIYIYLHILYI